MEAATDVRLTRVHVTVPELPTQTTYLGLHVEPDEVTPAQFLAAFERVRQDYPEAEIRWDFSSREIPVITYETDDCSVRIAGPRLPNRDPAPPDAEKTLRGEAARNGE